MKNLLLLSNSTLPGSPYLQWALSDLSEFLSGDRRQMVFIPYAGVTVSYDEYTQRVNDALEGIDKSVRGIHTFENPRKALESADGILVGGGNTFELLRQLYENELMDEIRKCVSRGVPYVGWSAGSNVAGASIGTTNDMPISFPESFDALGLVPYQINPHYTEATLPNHGGESRLQRLMEFLEKNQGSEVYCLPEGTYLRVENGKTQYSGLGLEGKILRYRKDPQIIQSGSYI